MAWDKGRAAAASSSRCSAPATPLRLSLTISISRCRFKSCEACIQSHVCAGAPSLPARSLLARGSGDRPAECRACGGDACDETAVVARPMIAFLMVRQVRRRASRHEPRHEPRLARAAALPRSRRCARASSWARCRSSCSSSCRVAPPRRRSAANVLRASRPGAASLPLQTNKL